MYYEVAFDITYLISNHFHDDAMNNQQNHRPLIPLYHSLCVEGLWRLSVPYPYLHLKIIEILNANDEDDLFASEVRLKLSNILFS